MRTSKGFRILTRVILLVAAGLIVALLAAACDGNGDDDEDDGGDATPTVVASPAGGPSGDAETPAGSPAAGGYQLTTTLPLANFAMMLGLELVPGSDNEALVLTQFGEIHRITLDESAAPELFADLSGLMIAEPGFEEGLLGLAFSPNFESDGRLFIHYTAGDPKRGVIAWFPVVDGVFDIDDQHVVIEVEQPFQNHNGGQIVFGPDGYLYISLGDGGAAADPEGNGRNLSTLLGSILRLDVSGDEGYEVPPDNPFVDTPDARPEIYAYGLRNPWRLSFDRETGDLWAGDVGQNAWEETDRIIAGGNYGWDTQEAFECFDATACDTTDLIEPRSAYANTGLSGDCSVTGGFVYRGTALPELDGWYVYADFCSGKVWAVNTADESEPVLLAETGLPIASFAELPDGEIVALTFGNAIALLERG